VNDSVNIIKTRIADSDSKIEFITKIGENIPDMLFGDEVRIRQILLNILSNAVKYTKEGSVSFLVNGQIRDEKLILQIDVIDTGKGIKEEDLKKLFGDFVQVDLTNNRGIEGTGLGLAITKSLVKAMGGSINVKSEYGKGSTFTITLPQEINSLEHTASLNFNTTTAKTVNNKTIVFLAPRAKILIVDDIVLNLRVAKGLMSPYNMQVDLSSSGADAIEKIKNENYDLVFMDHMMPEMDGVETTKRIREFNRELPIIALTATAIVGMKEMFLGNGFSDFLPKPIDIRKLNEILEKWIPKEKRDN
jgi:CheY-like chemotaxis protein/anti-sigma regulatory factor (Ser/Thr protein kinase)